MNVLLIYGTTERVGAWKCRDVKQDGLRAVGASRGALWLELKRKPLM